MKNIIAYIVFSLLIIAGCDNTVQTGSGRGSTLPNVTGGAGEVLVVVDDYIWKGRTGELLKDILMEEFPGLPQSEPRFDLTQISSASLDNLFKYHRSIVLVTINESVEEASVKFSKDVWAKSQILVKIVAPSNKELYELIEKNRERIKNFLIQYDRKRLTENYKRSKDIKIQSLLAETHHIRLGIPRGYNVDISTESYTSVSIETPDYSQVIQIYEYPAGSDDMQSGKLLQKRNDFTRKYVEGPAKNSYMTTATTYPPIFYDIKRDGMDIVEIRGLWELVGGFMGGPFVSHSVYDQKRERIITVEGYVYYPNHKKRIKIRQLEAILYSLEVI